MIKWVWKHFDEISAAQMHQMLKLRQDVFVLEQKCIYPDIDDLDKLALHLFGYSSKAKSQDNLAAYLRMFKPGIKFPEISFGRVLTNNQYRGTGLGKKLIAQALLVIDEQYPNDTIKISAQSYLESFYSSFGFSSISQPYDEDGIMHIDMLRIPV